MGLGRILRNRNVGDIVVGEGRIYGYDEEVYFDFGTDGKIIVPSTTEFVVEGDFTVEGSITFGDACVDTLSILATTTIHNNQVLNFEGIADDLDGLKISCDSSGNATMEATAGELTLTTSGIGSSVTISSNADTITLPTTILHSIW